MADMYATVRPQPVTELSLLADLLQALLRIESLLTQWPK